MVSLILEILNQGCMASYSSKLLVWVGARQYKYKSSLTS